MMKITNNFPNKPRIERTLKKARWFIKKLNICWLPVNPVVLFKECGLLLYNCQEAEKVYGRPDPFGVRKEGVDAKTYRSRDEGIYITVFDESMLPERIRWTLVHELAHIVLGHLTDFEITLLTRSGLCSKQYEVLEREADTFAAEVLAPMAIIKEMGNLEYDDIIQICHISKEAAQNRIKDIAWHGNKKAYKEADAFLRLHFKTYLTPVTLCVDSGSLPVRNAIKKNPKVAFMNKKHRYIPIGKNGRFAICPRCGNKAFSQKARFCRMCGLYLYNDCTNTSSSFVSWCGANNPGDARYCEYCGAETELTRLGLLMTWEELIQAHGDVAGGSDPDITEIDKNVIINLASWKQK
jgi:Zn-dependent peptidase ImmA (M78 family)